MSKQYHVAVHCLCFQHSQYVSNILSCSDFVKDFVIMRCIS